MKLIIADDHAVVREGIRHLLSECPNVNEVDQVGDGEELLAKACKINYDLVILDIALPGRSGLDVLLELKRIRPRMRILILTMYDDPQIAIQAVKLGASGYVGKSDPPENLAEAVRKIIAGERYISPQIAPTLAFAAMDFPNSSVYDSLSRRELQVLLHIGEGKSTKEIAGDLFISEKTVRTYRMRIQSKLGIKSTAALVRYAIKNQLAS